MTTYEALVLMIAFAVLILKLIDILDNRVGGRPLIERPTSHTTVRTVRYTAVL
jgi:hypothetical protein